LKDPVEVLFCLAYVLTHHAREIDLVETELQLGRDHFRGHRLARSRTAGKQCVGAFASGEMLLESPIRHHALAPGHAPAKLTKLLEGVGGKHDVVPGVDGLDLACQRRQFVARLRARGSEKVAAVHTPPSPERVIRRGLRRIRDLCRGKRETRRERFEHLLGLRRFL
jgi:hypothetical protein